MVPIHRRIQGGAKGARTPRGSEAKTVKSSLFLANFYLISSFSTPLAWNSAYASAISNTGSAPKPVTWYWHFVGTESNFSTWQDILQKSAFTSWYLTVISWNLVYQRIDSFFSNFSTRQFWSQKQLKTNWAHFSEHKERPQCANIWQSLA